MLARTGRIAVALLAALLLLFIILPLVALFLRTTPSSLLSGLRHPGAVSTLVLSLETTAITRHGGSAGDQPVDGKLGPEE